jgi:hypothetical protein
VEVFGAARSGAILRNEAFASRLSWTTDISIDIDGRMLVVEYDGAYWHAAQAKVSWSRLLVARRPTPGSGR